MPKKTFADAMKQKALNPTMPFITAREEPQEAQTEGIETQGRPAPEASAGASKPGRSKGNPRTKRQEKELPPAPPVENETKSRRLQLLIKPSIHQAIKLEADARHTSVNDLINSILQDHIITRK